MRAATLPMLERSLRARGAGPAVLEQLQAAIEDVRRRCSSVLDHRVCATAT